MRQGTSLQSILNSSFFFVVFVNGGREDESASKPALYSPSSMGVVVVWAKSLPVDCSGAVLIWRNSSLSMPPRLSWLYVAMTTRGEWAVEPMRVGSFFFCCNSWYSLRELGRRNHRAYEGESEQNGHSELESRTGHYRDVPRGCRTRSLSVCALCSTRRRYTHGEEQIDKQQMRSLLKIVLLRPGFGRI